MRLGKAETGLSERYLVKVVLLCELHSFAPSQAALVDVGSDPTELSELVGFQPGSQADLVVIVVCGDAFPECVVVFLLNQQLIDSLIDCSEVGFLDSQQVLLDQGQMIGSAHDRDDTCMIHSGLQNLQSPPLGVKPLSRIVLKTQGHCTDARPA